MAMPPPREIMLKSSHLAFLGLFTIIYVSKREEMAQLSMESCLQHWHCIKSWLLSLINYEKERDWAAKALAPDSFKSGSNCSSLRQQCCVVNLHHSLCPTDTLPVWHTGSCANIPCADPKLVMLGSWFKPYSIHSKREHQLSVGSYLSDPGSFSEQSSWL